MVRTKLYKITSTDDENEIIEAAGTVRNGGIVAIPTETVYGLAVCMTDENAIDRLLSVRKCTHVNPMSVYISDMYMLVNVAMFIPQEAYTLAEKFWPGPLTIVLPKMDVVPDRVSGNLTTVGICMPSSEIVRRFIRYVQLPVVVPSANISGEPCATDAQRVIELFNGKIDGIIDGPKCEIGVESTIISLNGQTPKLIRPGPVTLEQLEKVLGRVEVDRAVMSRLKRASMVSSPGLLYRHNAPKTKLVLAKMPREKYIEKVNSMPGNIGALCFEEDAPYITRPCVVYGRQDQPETQAYRIFDALYEVDRLGVDVVYAHSPSELTGLSLAVYTRLLRAADFDVIRN